MYEIIPNALEHITNIPFTEYVKKEHFDPLGMGATSYKADGLTAAGHHPKLGPGGKTEGVLKVEPEVLRLGFGDAATNIFSTAHDMVSHAVML